jgi:HK97 family phage major capsid protein
MPQEQIQALAEALSAELGRTVEATSEAVAAALREWGDRVEEMAQAAANAETMEPEELDEDSKAAAANFASVKSALGLEEDADADAVRARIFALQMGVKHAGRTRLAAVVADFDKGAESAPKTHTVPVANARANGAKSQRYGGISVPRESLKGVKDALGYMIDGNNRALKSLGYTIGQNGGWLVNRETSAELIELFYANEVALALGATRVDMGSTETLTYRKMKSGATAYWGAMGQTTTQSQPAFGIVNLNLRELVAEVPIAQRLIKNSAVNVEQLVRNDIVKAMNLAADYSFLYGTGSKTGSNAGYEPLGLINHPDVTETTIATNGKIPTPADFVSRWGAIEDANVPASDSWGLACSPRTLRTIRNTTDTTGQLIPEERFTQGYGVQTTTQISNSITTGTSSTTSDAFFGAWEYMVVGVGQDVELIVDTSIYVRQREVLVQGVMYVDMGISHPEAFQVLRGLKA